ncbi:MAG: hypothetical protein IIZ75_07995 [Lachnospiraceae bacterium]|nr:hypothetical protein [Lachnospiraceae bacterium]
MRRIGKKARKARKIARGCTIAIKPIAKKRRKNRRRNALKPLLKGMKAIARR